MNYMVVILSSDLSWTFRYVFSDRRKEYGMPFNLILDESIRVATNLEMLGLLKNLDKYKWELTEFGKSVTWTFDGSILHLEIPIEN